MSISENNVLLERLDKIARWTGIPKLSERPARRRAMRFLPIVTLALGTVGFGIILFYPDQYWFGYAGMMLCFCLSVFFPIFGPIKQAAQPNENLDELDRMMGRKAYLFTFGVISIVAIVGIWCLIGLSAYADWKREILIKAMVGLLFYLMSLLTTLPTLYASWSFPTISEED